MHLRDMSSRRLRYVTGLPARANLLVQIEGAEAFAYPRPSDPTSSSSEPRTLGILKGWNVRRKRVLEGRRE